MQSIKIVFFVRLTNKITAVMCNVSHNILDLKIIQNSVQKLKLAGHLSQKMGYTYCRYFGLKKSNK